MIDVTALDDTTRNSLLPSQQLEGKTPKEIINKLSAKSARQLFDEWLRYEGIIGYTDQIIEMLDDLRNAEAALEWKSLDK